MLSLQPTINKSKTLNQHSVFKAIDIKRNNLTILPMFWKAVGKLLISWRTSTSKI